MSNIINIRVTTEKCSGCGLCIKSCPFNCIALVDGVAFIQESCRLCGACVSVCEREAIVSESKNEKTGTIKYSGILIFVEQRKNVIAPVVFELIDKGRELADRLGEKLECVILGKDVKQQAEELFHYRVDRIHVYDSPFLEEFRDDPYSELLVCLIQEIKPSIFLLGATSEGRSIAPRIATRLRTGLTADCTGLETDSEGNLLQTRPAFGGNIMATIECRNTRPQIATVRYKVMKKAERVSAYKGELVCRDFDEKSIRNRTWVKKVAEAQGKGEASLTEANIIVSGGKGLGNPEGFKLVKELADVLGGAVGASRITVDEGWIPYPHQVGLSGRTVRPKLYIACGISGSVQHLAGMQTSDIVVAINKDPSAPIFRIADYGIVGDLYEVIPEIIKLVRELKEQK
ncbi:MAG: hypothetical protein QG670_843 [Thermoproteota archaeon]|nr:hypothetical protein [Thermoproteota archaeon]